MRQTHQSHINAGTDVDPIFVVHLHNIAIIAFPSHLGNLLSISQYFNITFLEVFVL